VNGTAVATRNPSLGELLGNLVYAPAYPGALFGNMSVVFGNKLNASASCADIIALIGAYTGPYPFSLLASLFALLLSFASLVFALFVSLFESL
jgi:hypothetical protein